MYGMYIILDTSFAYLLDSRKEHRVYLACKEKEEYICLCKLNIIISFEMRITIPTIFSGTFPSSSRHFHFR